MRPLSVTTLSDSVGEKPVPLICNCCKITAVAGVTAVIKGVTVKFKGKLRWPPTTVTVTVCGPATSWTGTLPSSRVAVAEVTVALAVAPVWVSVNVIVFWAAVVENPVPVMANAVYRPDRGPERCWSGPG